MKTLYGELPITEGSISVLEQDLCKLKSKHLPVLRQRLGIVFQDFRLLAQQTVHDNLDVVLRSTGKKKKADREQRIGEVLSLVGLTDKASNFPHELSGGEQQRVCIARALINSPEIILADEPTGALDSHASYLFMEQLLQRNTEDHASILMVTHDAFSASYAKRILFLKDGKIFNELYRGEYSRSSFYQKILDVMMLLGGDVHAIR